jgi:hypothetical protein
MPLSPRTLRPASSGFAMWHREISKAVTEQTKLLYEMKHMRDTQ